MDIALLKDPSRDYLVDNLWIDPWMVSLLSTAQELSLILSFKDSMVTKRFVSFSMSSLILSQA